MANTTNGSRKRSLAQATQGENENPVQDNVRRQRHPTLRQQQIMIIHSTVIVNEDESDDPDMESHDEGDMGYGVRPGGGFTSVGTVPHGRSVAQKKQLVPETDPFPEPLQPFDVNHTGHSEPTANGRDDINEEMAPPTTRLSGPISSLPPSGSPTPFHVRARHVRTTPPSSPCIQREHTTGPSSPRVRHERTTSPPPHILHERTTPPSSPHALEQTIPPSSPRLRRTRTRTTPSSQLTTPSSLIRLPPAPFRQSYTPGPKPKASDYEGSVEKMLLNAMHEYACLILTTDAFPDEAKQTQWAEATWRAACEEVGVHYECSVRMIRLITGRGCWARGFLKDAVRNNFKVFKFKEGSTEEVKRYNQDLRLVLLRDDAFHHKNQEELTGFGEHRVVIDILRDALFEDSKSYGVKYSRYFNPISINLLALMFTMIEFLINEWSTGERKKSNFRSRTYSETFDAHYLRTEQWCSLEPTVTTNIRKRIFRTLMKKAGASEQANGRGAATGMTASMKERAKEALAGRTGETDDEDD